MTRVIRLLGLMLLWSAVVIAAPAERFPGSADVAIRNGIVRDARNEAIKEAKRQAVIAAAEKHVPAAVWQTYRKTLEAKIRKNPDVFILSYTTAADREEDGQYRVVIDVLVNVDRIKETAAEIARPEAETSRGSVLVLVAVERPEGWGRLPEMEATIAGAIRDAGLDAAGPKIVEAMGAGREFDQAIGGRFRDFADGADAFGVRFLIFVKGHVERKEDKSPILFTVLTHDLERRAALSEYAFKLSDVATVEAAAAVGPTLAARAIRDIQAVDREAAAEERELTLVLIGLSDYRVVERVRGAVAKSPVVRSAVLTGFESGGRASIRIRMAGDENDLAALVLKIDDPLVRLRQIPARAGEVDFEVKR